MNGKVTAGAAAGAAAFPGKVSPLLLLHQEGWLRKLLGAAGKEIPEKSGHFIAAAQTRSSWKPCRVWPAHPTPGDLEGCGADASDLMAAGTEQKLLQSQQDVSQEPHLPFTRLVEKKHRGPHSSAALQAQPRHGWSSGTV